MYHYYLRHSGVTMQLQCSTLDNIEAHSMTIPKQFIYKEERQIVDIRFQTIYDHAVLLAEKVSVIPALPRQVIRQQDFSNAPTESLVAYYFLLLFLFSITLL